MHINRKRILFYSFLLLFMMACRTYACSYVTQPLMGVGCERFFEIPNPGSLNGYSCSISCPGMDSDYKFDVYGNEGLSAVYGMKFEQVQEQYCPVPESASSDTVDATEEPTEAPQEKAAPTDAPTDSAPLKPLLTGAFTACDNTARYVNFTIADGALAYDPAKVKVLFNEQAVTCTPAASNSKTLTCIYPPDPYGPPAYIQVYIGEEKVNDFKFPGGSICNAPSQPNNSDDDQEQEPSSTEPAPTDESSD